MAHTFTLDGPEARHVTVELDVRRGLPAFTIVGLADTAVREARERIRTAIRNCGYEFPARRITVNLAPGDLPKAGPGFDLAHRLRPARRQRAARAAGLERTALFGELALDGSVRPCRGTLAVAQAARRHGLEAVALACAARATRRRSSTGLQVAGVRTCASAARVLDGGAPASCPRRRRSRGERRGLAARTGRTSARSRAATMLSRALILAAAGGHNILLSGAPGTGKTMLARRTALDPAGADAATRRSRSCGSQSAAGLPVGRCRASVPSGHRITRSPRRA